MYQPNDLDLWRQRRHDLLREVETYRLAGRLRSSRPTKIGPVRGSLAGLLGKQRLGAPADTRGKC